MESPSAASELQGRIASQVCPRSVTWVRWPIQLLGAALLLAELACPGSQELVRELSRNLKRSWLPAANAHPDLREHVLVRRCPQYAAVSSNLAATVCRLLATLCQSS